MNEAQLVTIEEIIASLEQTPGALLPILHAIQEAIGYISPEAITSIAAALNLTRAEVHGVVSFYHHFRTAPAGKHTLQLCRAEACQAVGARELEDHAKRKLKLDYHQTTADRSFSLEPVYCLGNCACGPSLRIDDRIVGRVTPERFDRLIDELSLQVLELE